MSEPAAPEERAAWRAALRRDAFPVPPRFGPVPERIEVTYCTEFCGDACTCSLAATARRAEVRDGSDEDEAHG